MVLICLCGVLLAGWSYMSIPVAQISLSENRHCSLVFHEFLTGKCVLSYYKNNTRVGTVVLHSDLLNNPLAIFPGPDGQTVVCLSDLDTFQAAFTIDLTNQNNNGVAIPDWLRKPDQEAVDRSDFLVRACTKNEVEFVANYIKTANMASLSNCVRWGASRETREAYREFLICATTPHDWRDSLLKHASPLMLPQN